LDLHPGGRLAFSLVPDICMTFADLGLSDELLKAVSEAGYTRPTPIQAQAIPPVLMMKDIIGIAQTGTGKTASLRAADDRHPGEWPQPRADAALADPRADRELAAQVAENFEKYGKYHKLSMALLIGGVNMGDQIAALEKGVDVLIATPGRLMDLFGRGKIMLTGCSLLVIDEADRMLDMGFIPDIEEICTKLPASSARLCSSPQRCRRSSRNWPTSSSTIPSRSKSRAPRRRTSTSPSGW
jgi:superfamily II DNA/RNA helicase